jgi:hypothetical protein
LDRTLEAMMSHIADLNDQVRRCNSKIEEHLEAQAVAMVTTSNVSITLATALAAGIAILSRQALPNAPSPLVVTLLLTAAGTTVASLLLGVTVLVSKSGISHRAVKMWDASKHQAIAILRDGGGDEAATQVAYALMAPEFEEDLGRRTTEYEEAFERTRNLMAWQAALLTVGVGAALAAALMVYSGYGVA